MEMCTTRTTTLFFLLLLLLLLEPHHVLAAGAHDTTHRSGSSRPHAAAAATGSGSSSSSRIPQPSPAPGDFASERLEREYLRLLDATEDKVALEAIRDLHRQLDGDNDGTIEPSETGEFVRGDLFRGGDQRRGNRFHDKVRRRRRCS